MPLFFATLSIVLVGFLVKSPLALAKKRPRDTRSTIQRMLRGSRKLRVFPKLQDIFTALSAANFTALVTAEVSRGFRPGAAA